MNYSAASSVLPIDEGHDRKSFDCGCAHLNQFLQRYAKQARARAESSTVVMVDGLRIVGFATLVSSVLTDGKHERPVLRLGRFGVDEAYKRRGIGEALMRHVLESAIQLASIAGCVGVIVDAKTCSRADEYYAKFGFKEMPNETTPPGTVTMILRHAAIQAAIARAPRLA